MKRICAALVAMTAAASAAPHVPDGWQEDRDATAAAMASGRLRVHVFRAPGADATYTVVRDDDATGTTREQAATVGAGLAATGFMIVRDDERDADGQTIADVIATAADGRRAHARTIAGLVEHYPMRMVVLSGVCIGRDLAAVAACERELPLLSVPVDPIYVPADYSNFYILGAAGGGGLLVAMLGVAWWRTERRRRDLAKSPPLVEGEVVTLSGTVRPADSTLEAPLSGKRCVVYRTHARVFSRASVPRLLAEPFELETVPFMLETPRGTVRVDAPALQVAVTPETAVGVAPERIAAFLDRHRVELREGIVFDEIAVEPGQTATVRGVLRVRRDEASTAERGYRDDAPTIRELVAAADQPVTLLRVW